MPIARLLEPRLAFVAVTLASAWLCATMPVFSQEAYYWTYAQHPDLAYFDHPPMVAWLIWIGTGLFGDGAIGIRFGTWLCGLGTTAIGARLLADFGAGRRVQTAWILLNVATPVLVMVRFLANPDPPLVFAWTASMWALWQARGGRLGWWLLAGATAGAALLGKYSAAFLLPSGIVLLLADPDLRRQLRQPGPWLAVVVAAAVFSPVVIWNAGNHFESFRFQTGERFAHGALGVRWFLEFVGGQALMFHPLLLLAFAAALPWLLRRCRVDARARWLLAFALPLPVWFLVASLWIQVKINWLAPAAVPVLLAVVLWWHEHGAQAIQSRRARLAAWTLLAVPAILPFAPAMRLLPPGHGSSWSGWPEIARHAVEWEDRFDPEDGVEGNFFYFAADYRDAAQLGRCLLRQRREAPPEHEAATAIDFEPTLAQNVMGMPALQYDHWNPPGNRIGQDAIFVLPRPQQRPGMVDEAARHFTSIARIERIAVQRLGVHLVDADLYLCRGYLGPDVPR